MSWGTEAKELIETDLADLDIVTPLTHVIRTSTGTSDGGYSSPSYTTSSSTTIYGIPTTYYNQRLNFTKFGNLKTGELVFLVSADTSISKEDQIVYSSGTFNVREINPVLISDTVIAQEIRMEKDL
jgi:hypothetical protein